jgi:hypothetical protein
MKMGGILTAILVPTVVLCGGCGSPAISSGGNDLPGLTAQLVEQLKTVQDEASAKAARAKLEAIADQIDAIQEQTKKGKAPAIGNPDDFASRQEKALTAYGEELSRISNIPAAAKELQGMIKKVAP